MGERFAGSEEVRGSTPRRSTNLNIDMEYGFFSDNQIPKFNNTHDGVNSYGYRCPEWTPLPKGKKNVVVLGCSHTFGEGLDVQDVWISIVQEKLNSSQLRFWNMSQPGSSADLMFRILYSCEKVLFPKIIICCWPAWSRRELYKTGATNLTGSEDRLALNEETEDKNNLLKNIFLTEKFAEHNGAKTFHCFAEEVYDIPMPPNTLNSASLSSCWPIYDKHFEKITDTITEPDLASDGKHYGKKHHTRFAELFLKSFQTKLR